ncbi:MAG: 50S ribosomal protein L3 [Candidatus Shikimatogenerans bostrichidophilus]|nr:MAG: 50S ribosomal protein L3 [Candidatus Shikimatogenerans bostrichidophilus]
MIGIIGKKKGMISFFKDNKIYPCTIIESNKCKIIEIKKKINNKYSIIIGYNKIKKVNKPLKGYFKKNNVNYYKKIIELNKLKKNSINKYKKREFIDINIFKIGEKINITGYSIGKGFQGVVKRYGFSGVGGKTHGQHNRLRSSGSIGAGSYPSKVIKGMKMAGRMGNNKITIKNLEIIYIDKNKKFFLIKGSIPGKKNNYLIIKKNESKFN